MAIQEHPQPCQGNCLVTENMWQTEIFFFFFFRYVHFMMMWYTFITDSSLYNEHTACQFDTLVQLKHVPFNHWFLQN